jgi:PKD repeat protein
MLRILQTLLFTAILMFFPGLANAGHVTGGDITYTAAGNNRYLITVKIFRDCNGVTLSNSPITVTPLNCSGTGFTQTLTQRSTRDVTPICASVASKCAGGSINYGTEEHIFSDTIDLSSYTSCCNFNISWEQCCRASNVGSGANFYIFTRLNKCIVNSSPVVNGNVPILCVNQDHCYNLGARDLIDNDSLSYSFDSSMQSMTTAVPSPGGGYSFKTPLHYLGFPGNGPLPSGFHLDSISGDLCFRPTKVEISVIALKITEWRKINGVVTMVGETRRDMMLVVDQCQNNKFPQIGANNAISACSGKKVCIDIPTADADAANTVNISWDSAIANATFTPYFTPASQRERATFCWTPSDSDTLSPHSFTVFANDNVCPVNGTVKKKFTVTVTPTTNVTATRQITKLGCGRVSFDAIPSQTATLNYLWNIKKGSSILTAYSQKTFTHTFTDPGTYYIDLTIAKPFHCPINYIDTLVVDSFLKVDLPNDTSLCKGQSLQIVPVVSGSQPPYRYKWSSGVNDTLPALNITLNNTGTWSVTVSDSACAASDSILVAMNPPPAVEAGADRILCMFDNMVGLSGIPAGGTWSGPGVSGGTFNPQVSGHGAFYPVYTYIDNKGCYGYDSTLFTVDTIPFVDAGSDTSVCSNSSINLGGFPSGGFWSGSGVSGNVFAPPVSPQPREKLFYTLFSKGGCKGKDSLFVDVILMAPVNAGADTAVCFNAGPIILQGSPAGGNWSGTGVSANKFHPAGVNGFSNLLYTYTDSSGCSDSDERLYMIFAPTFVSAGNDKSFCPWSAAVNLTGQPAGGSWTGNGVIGNNFDPAIAGTGDHALAYQVTDANGCLNSDQAIMKISRPVAQFTATPISGSSPLSVSFTDMSAGSHSWSWNFGDPQSGNNSSTLKNPSHVYSDTGAYSVRLIVRDSTANACADTITLSNYINVSPGTGISSTLNNKGIEVYPNPATKNFEVVLIVPSNEFYTMEMHDMTGRRLKEFKELNSGRFLVNCEGMEAGIYLITVSGRGGEVYKTRLALQ